MKRHHLHILLLIVAISAWSCQKDPLGDPVTRSDKPIGGSETRSYPATTGNKWAVIISGGGNYTTNFVRYWNDCAFFYSTMKNVYGLSDGNIIVAMSDGTDSGIDRLNEYGIPESSPWDLDGDNVSDIDSPATTNDVNNIFSSLKNEVKPGDEVIIFVTDHGAYSSGDAALVLWNNDTMSASDFKINLNKLSPEATKHLVMGQCYSGGFISELQSVKQMTISTACSATQLSYSTSDYLYDEFLYHWTAAIAGQYPGGGSADADADSDGVITVREAFNYAQTNDTMTETPLFYEYKNLFGNIPFIYQYKYIEPYISGPKDINRGGTYTYQIVHCNPDINPATLVSNSDFTVVSSSDSTIVLSVNSTGGLKHGPVTFNITSSGTNFLNSNSSVDDVVIWQTGSFVDNLGVIMSSVNLPDCYVQVTPRFKNVSSGFYWDTTDSDWRVFRRLLSETSFRYEGDPVLLPSELSASVALTNPFGQITTLTKTIDLSE